MFDRRKPWLIGMAFGILAAGCGTSPPAAETAAVPASAEITYLDRESQQLVRGPRQEKSPAVHPTTGRATLVQAFYCPECREWQAGPPPELRSRSPLGPVCAKHRIPLQEDGPLEGGK